MKKTPTAAQNAAHIDRLILINKPFPAIRNVIYTGKIWGGCLVPRPGDGMFLTAVHRGELTVPVHVAEAGEWEAV